MREWIARFWSKGILCATLLAAFASSAATYIQASSGAIVPGEWNADFATALAYADSRHVPMVVMVVADLDNSCGNCERLQQACLSQTFLQWVERKKPVMVFTKRYFSKDAAKFAQPEKEYSHGTPLIAAYWAKEDGTILKRTFSGVNGKMPAGKNGNESLASQFIRSLDLVMEGYPYLGGDFRCTDASEDRLELEEGYTNTSVRVPLVRTTPGNAAQNILVCNGASNTVDWAADEAEKLIEVSVPAGLSAGESILLKLFSGETPRALSAIHIVAPQPNSHTNPYWLGEFTPDELPYGEWTQDYDAALAKIASSEEDASILAVFSGPLWCPYCKGMDEGVFSTPEFAEWGKKNNVVFVLFDQARAGKTAPRLLSYEPDPNRSGASSVSGASYLSRKNISPEEATPVIARTTELSTQTWLAPEATAARLGNPTLLLINKDGTLAARAKPFAEGRTYDLHENLARLDDLLLLRGANETNNYASTTTLSINPDGDTATATLQVNDSSEVWRLANVPSGRIVFTVTSKSSKQPVRLSLLQEYDGSWTNVLVSSEEKVVFEFGENDTAPVALKAQAFFSGERYGGNTAFAVEVSSRLVLLPKETAQSVSGPTARIALEKGKQYKLTGFSSIDEEIFVAQETGEVELTLAGESATYQLWSPGTLAFSEASRWFLADDGAGEVRVVRSGGVSGKAVAHISIDPSQSSALNGERMLWEDVALEWVEGESGAKSAFFAILPSGERRFGQVSFVLNLATENAEAATPSEMEVGIFDTDKPVLANASYAVALNTSFDASAAFAEPLFNAHGTSLKPKVVSGKLPSGVKVSFDSTTGLVYLSGSAKKAGTYVVEIAFTEKRNGKAVTGPATKLEIVCKDPVASNKMLGSVRKATLPLYGEEGETGRLLAGSVELSLSKSNRIAAKFQGFAATKAVSFKGLWSELDEDGMALATLVAKNGMTLLLALAPDGNVSATLSASYFASPLSSGDLFFAFASRYSGAYTVALPETSSSDPAGSSWLSIKIASTGKTKCTGMLANGQSVSATTQLVADSDGNAVVPIFKSSAKILAAFPLKVRANALSADSLRAVQCPDGTFGRWVQKEGGANIVHDVLAWGSLLPDAPDYYEAAFEAFATDTLPLALDVEELAAGGKYGAAVSASEAFVLVSQKTLALDEKRQGVKFSFAKKTGVFKGSAQVLFAKGKTISVPFKGVIIPGWHDCGCAPGELDESVPFHIADSQPFALGSAYFKDTLSGKTLRRSIAVRVGWRGITQ